MTFFSPTCFSIDIQYRIRRIRGINKKNELLEIIFALSQSVMKCTYSFGLNRSFDVLNTFTFYVSCQNDSISLWCLIWSVSQQILKFLLDVIENEYIISRHSKSQDCGDSSVKDKKKIFAKTIIFKSIFECPYTESTTLYNLSVYCLQWNKQKLKNILAYLLLSEKLLN